MDEDEGSLNGDIEARMENADGDSETSALQSMGYIDNGTGMGRREEDSTDSRQSVLQMVLLITVAVFFGGSLLYFLITGLLAIFGVSL
ncbi:hypothetical protein C477_12327 [Haloterrigena salina JCM 13891]|uniref:Uncharacterized protein n=1 Tax=Haloterrigena salina JCM 13891 TaxID=1227488 RepID=M0C6N0_9EURY|nr:hypothetical protein [Haloterrigena salina]ELZ17992.1 hypothetical protein C477_12327 [Haloterrigena salina JCM 13891]